MPVSGSFFARTFTFGFDARTSRGRMSDRRSWFIKVVDDGAPGITGYGECGPLPGLSVDDVPEFEDVLTTSLKKISEVTLPTDVPQMVRGIVPDGFPSIAFGLETALLDLQHGGTRLIFDNSFIRGVPIPINGLVWMGDRDSMLRQVRDLVAKRFTCIKVKVGGLDFDVECAMLREIRERYDADAVTLRLDANGAFGEDEVMSRLETLAKFSVHSIEQPLKAGSPQMAEVCRRSPIPVALDEELIGKESEKTKLLETLRPAYIILKPSLHGGIWHCREWIRLAEENNIGWWITSALESGIGLNAIAQFTAEYNPTIPQGLGTGSIYTDNIPSPLRVVNGCLVSDPLGVWHVPDG